MSDVRWPTDWEVAEWGDVTSPTLSRAEAGYALVLWIPTDDHGRPDLDGLLARLRLDPAEVEALRWLAKVVESSETWLKSKSGLQPKAILSALDKWRRVWDGAALAERGGESD